MLAAPAWGSYSCVSPVCVSPDHVWSNGSALSWSLRCAARPPLLRVTWTRLTRPLFDVICLFASRVPRNVFCRVDLFRPLLAPTFARGTAVPTCSAPATFLPDPRRLLGWNDRQSLRFSSSSSSGRGVQLYGWWTLPPRRTITGASRATVDGSGRTGERDASVSGVRGGTRGTAVSVVENGANQSSTLTPPLFAMRAGMSETKQWDTRHQSGEGGLCGERSRSSIRIRPKLTFNETRRMVNICDSKGHILQMLLLTSHPIHGRRRSLMYLNYCSILHQVDHLSHRTNHGHYSTVVVHRYGIQKIVFWNKNVFKIHDHPYFLYVYVCFCAWWSFQLIEGL